LYIKLIESPRKIEFLQKAYFFRNTPIEWKKFRQNGWLILKDN